MKTGNKIKIKKGDTVLIIAGKDRNKKGKVNRTITEKNQVVVDGVNLTVKHMKARRAGEKGQKVKIAKPIDVSNVMFICPKCGKTARIGYRLNVEKDKERICKKCNQEI